MNRRLPIAGLLLLAASATASAATLEIVSGEASVNQGLGFRSVTGRVAAQTGSTLHVPAGSQAYLVYENGCRVHVTPGAFVRVQKIAPCDGNGDLPAKGAVATQQNQNNCDPNAFLGCGDNTTLIATTLIGGGLLTGGIIAANRKNNSSYYIPVSP